jgi:hypothetical protein
MVLTGAGEDRDSIAPTRAVANAEAAHRGKHEVSRANPAIGVDPPTLMHGGSLAQRPLDPDPQRSGARPAPRPGSREFAVSSAEEDSRDDEPNDRREPRQPAPTRLVLDPIRIADAGLSLRVTGHDARGPRDLVLWRMHEGNAAVVAHGRSHRDGAMEFPRLVAPHTGLVLVATPAWETPDGPRASSAQKVAPREPESRPTAGGGRRGSAGR